jgi:hypothetical protein
VNWVLGVIQLDDEKFEPLNIQGNFLSQRSTLFQDFGPYNPTKHLEPLFCCSVTRVNSEFVHLSHEIQTSAQEETELVMKYFQEDLDTGPILAPCYSTFAIDYNE